LVKAIVSPQCIQKVSVKGCVKTCNWIFLRIRSFSVSWSTLYSGKRKMEWLCEHTGLDSFRFTQTRFRMATHLDHLCESGRDCRHQS